LIHLGVLFAITSILFLLFKKISKKNKLFINTAISTLLVFLLLDHENSGEGGILVLILVMVCKFFIQHQKKQIFNPVAFGIAIVTILSFLITHIPMPQITADGITTSFSAGSLIFPISFVFIVLSTVFNSIKRLKKLYVISSFLISSIIFSAILYHGDLNNIIPIYSSPMIFFIVGAILIDPKTCPGNYKEQIYFGIVAGIFYILTLTLTRT